MTSPQPEFGEPTPSGRSVIADKDAVRSLRKQRGMTQEQFAHEMDIGLSTLQKLEGGKAVDISTVQWLASKAKVEYESLLPVAKIWPTNRDVALHVVDTDDPEAVPALMKRLTDLINRKHEIVIFAVSPQRSLLIRASLHDEDLVAAITALAEGRLADLGIDSITLFDVPSDIWPVGHLRPIGSETMYVDADDWAGWVYGRLGVGANSVVVAGRYLLQGKLAGRLTPDGDCVLRSSIAVPSHLENVLQPVE